MTRRRRFRTPLERVEQSNICNLTRSLGGKPYVIGTRRRREDYQGTNQTPGIPDLWLWLPAVHARGYPALGLWWEAKRLGETRTPDQLAFGALCELSGTPYGWGTLDDYIAFLVEQGRLNPSSLPHYKQPSPEALARAGGL